MKKIIIMSLFIGSLFFSLVSLANPNSQSLDQIVAIVNDDVVSRSELNQMMVNVKLQMNQDHVPIPTHDVLQKQVLKQLINKKLQLQAARQAGVKITDAELEQTIERVAKQNGLSTKEFYQRINQEGMSTTNYKNEMHDQLTLHKVQQLEVVNRITVTPQEINHFMRLHPWQNNGPKEYHVVDILISVADNATPEEIAHAKKRAETMVEKLHQGQRLQTVLQAETTASHPIQNNDLGWRKWPEIPSAFADAISTMNTQEIAGPIQTANGFHLLHLVATRNIGPKQAAPDRKQIESMVMQRKFEDAVQAWVSKLHTQAYIVNNLEKTSS